MLLILASLNILNGVIYEGKEGLNSAQIEISKETNQERVGGTLKDVLVGADVFIGVSGPNCVTKEMVASCVTDEELSVDYILPYVYDKRVHKCVSESVKEAAISSHATKTDK